VTETVVVRPNEGETWERAKFRFRSSLFALVTLVDAWCNGNSLIRSLGVVFGITNEKIANAKRGELGLVWFKIP